MAHFHDFNPWAAKLVYLPSLEELADAAITSRPRKELLAMWRGQGKRLDAYLLKGGSYISAGIRFGKKPEQYVSVYCNQEKLQELYLKYGGDQ